MSRLGSVVADPGTIMANIRGRAVELQQLLSPSEASGDTNPAEAQEESTAIQVETSGEETVPAADDEAGGSCQNRAAGSAFLAITKSAVSHPGPRPRIRKSASQPSPRRGPGQRRHHVCARSWWQLLLYSRTSTRLVNLLQQHLCVSLIYTNAAPSLNLILTQSIMWVLLSSFFSMHRCLRCLVATHKRGLARASAGVICGPGLALERPIREQTAE